MSNDEADLDSWAGFRPEAGVQMGRYRIGRRVGGGGMGVVFEAEDATLKRKVAIKFLRPSKRRDTLTRDGERFLREAQAASQVDHPNAVATYDVGEHAGLRYMVLELLDARSAQSFVVTEGPMFWTEATRVVADACRALGAVHAAGIVHRDVKPDNILRSRKGVVKLTDFGVAKHTEADPGLTDTDALIGTPQYMSPEQCRGEELSASSDIYSMGGTYYTLLCGQRPFADKAKMANLLFAHCYGPVPDPARSSRRCRRACGRLSAARWRRCRWPASRRPRRCSPRSSRPSPRRPPASRRRSFCASVRRPRAP